MSAGGDAHIIAGNFIRVAQGPRKVLDLYRDGTLIFAGLANSRFLAWTDERGLKLHPIAVIEVIYNFARLYEKVLEDFGKQPSSITFRIGMRNLHHGTEKSSLSPYPSTSLFGNEPLQAPADNWVKDITLPRVGYRPEVTGVQLVQELYFWFGYAEENVPYTKLVNGIREVDVERIAGLQG
jgi:hypothetical protein